MKRALPFVVVALSACTTPTGTTSPNLIGTHDLVFVDQLAADGTVARLDVATGEDGGLQYVPNGLSSRYLFVTSADTNELRVLELYRELDSRRGFLAAPNPLEALSIPVLQRPTMLATDEGRNKLGARVSGQYVYAARPGGAEVSVVSLSARRQLGGVPVPVPGPVTAIGGAMSVGADQLLPATTDLFVATWDGANASVYRATLDTSPAIVDQQIRDGKVAFARVGLFVGAAFSALLPVAPLATRTVDGAAFCATSWCLAMSTRPTAAKAGESFLLDPVTGRSVRLAFPGAIRKLAAGPVTGRVYGVLDEAACGSAECGGVVAVDLVAGTAAAGFPSAKNVLGEPFGPLRVNGSIINGLSIAQGSPVALTYETSADGGSTLGYPLLQAYDELGAFANSDGYITYFSGLAGSIIDFDSRRTMVTAASVRTPGALPDGGVSLFNVDGGVLGAVSSGTVVQTTADYEQVFRTAQVSAGEGADWWVDLSDGYFVSQELVVASFGQIPGLVSLPTVAADGAFVVVPGGVEGRAQVGDTVVFETGNATDGYAECGRATVKAVSAGALEVVEVPATCAARSRCSVRGAGSKPLVVVGGSEGYMGRTAPGETFTYTRPLVLIPGGVVANRTSLTLVVPTKVPEGEGAYITFNVQAHMSPLRVAIDTLSSSLSACASSSTTPSQVVFGNVAMVLAPANPTGQTSATFSWKTFAVVPSGNAVVEIDQSGTRAGGTALTISDRAVCYR